MRDAGKGAGIRGTERGIVGQLTGGKPTPSINFDRSSPGFARE